MKSRIKVLVFTLILVGISLLYGYHETLLKRPSFWRQADCLSYTMNYYAEGMKFFEPSLHWVTEDGHGRTISEFPLMYYTVAALWKIFGPHEFIYRLLSILVVFIGLVCLFKLCSNQLQDVFWGGFIPLLLFTSPILVYYTNNFLTDASSLGLALIALYLTHKSLIGKKSNIWGVAVVFLIAGLLKITALMSLVALLIMYLLAKARVLNKRTIDNPTPLQVIGGMLIIAGPIVLWLIYSFHYNAINLQGVFLQGILPIWELDSEAVVNVWGQIIHKQVSRVLGTPQVVALLILLVASPMLHKGNRPFAVLAWIVAAGLVTYGILWFQALENHDYYFINLLVVVPAILLAFLNGLRLRSPVIFKNRWIKVLALIAVAFCVHRTSAYTHLRYEDISHSKYRWLVSDWENYYWSNYHTDHHVRIQPLETITPYLRSIGIQRSDLVVSIPDPSLNITLYLMDQKGFTDFGYDMYPVNERFELLKSLGAEYLIINDQQLVNELYMQPYINKPMGEYKGIKIYSLH